MQTPEFLVWSLERRCELRQIAGFEDPERTERHLRTLRAYSDAEEEGRVFEGICVEAHDDRWCKLPEPRRALTTEESLEVQRKFALEGPAPQPLPQLTGNGFQVNDALTLYGGLATAKAACLCCPVNATGVFTLAGCFGMLPLPGSEATHGAVERAIDELGCRKELAELFPETHPAWYGLWMRSPLDAKRAMFVKSILTAANSETRNGYFHPTMPEREHNNLTLGLETAHHHLQPSPFHVRLYPRGEVRGTWWNLVPHCQNCHAPWSEADCELCQVCGYVGRPASPPKRRARGTRPYWPLERMMGKEKAAEFLVRYEASRKEEKTKRD